MTRTRPTRVAVYARASTAEQHPEAQVHELRRLAEQRDWTIQGIYVDHGISGSRDRRPQLDAMLTAIHRGQVDLVAVSRLDRLGRSLRHLITVLDDLKARGVAFFSLHDSLDTSTPTGRLCLHVIASLAEFERELIRERTVAGLAAARRRGSRLGPPPSGIPPNYWMNYCA